MTGLREKQKQQRKEAILQAATELFEKHGYNATTVEQIAEKAAVSAPTVFNYFGSKQEILFALAVRADRLALEEALEHLPSMDNMVDSMSHINSLVVRHELSMLPLSIWREICNSPYSSVSKGYASVTQRLTEQTAQQLRVAQAKGRLTKHHDAHFIAQFLHDYSSLMFTQLVNQEVPDLDAYDRHIRQAFELIFNGLHP